MKFINILLAIAVSLGLGIGLFEVGLRLIGFSPPSINTEFDADLGWRGKPGSTIRNKSAEFDVELKIDALGLRDDYDDEAKRAKGRDVFRIIFLGDSFVNGYTVDREDLFVDRLERAYATEARKIEIVNAGIQGYSTDQQLRWLQKNGDAFDPDLVVLFPYENDIWWNASETYAGEPKPLYDEAGDLIQRTLPVRTPRSWFERTAIGNLPRFFKGTQTVETADGKSIPVEISSRLEAPPEATKTAEARTRVLIAKMAQEAKGLGAAFAVCPIPTKGLVAGSKGTLDDSRPHKLFVDAAKAAGATVLDPLNDLRKSVEDGATPYYDHDFHLDAEGNGVLAASLYKSLDAYAIVPSRSSESSTAPPEPKDIRGGKGWPKWPLWYAGLLAALGTLYSRTYPDESAASSYVRVGLLLGVVFATAMGVSALVGALPPVAGKILLVGLIIGLLTFVAYKLGDRIGTIFELLKAFTMRGHWYLMPLLSVLLTVGSLLVVAASSPLVAPFIYTLF